MKKIVTLLIAVIFLSCSNPMSKVYTEEGFMLDMVEIRESNGEETATKITGYIMQQAMITSFNEEAENMLVGKTYSELVKQSDDYEAQMKAKEEEEKRLAEEEKKRRKEIALKISESLTFALTKKGFAEYSYQEYITYTFTFKNKTDRDIAGVKGTVTFYDMFDEKIRGLDLSYDKGIKAGKTINYKAQTSFNQFLSEDKKLNNTELSKIKVTWEPEQLIFSDGEKILLE